jgi:hypothetical protein
VLRRIPRPPRRVFLSHAADDAALAHHLANVLRQAAAQPQVFVASRAGDIPPGADWLDVIEAELRQADTYVLLLTPRSVRRLWLWYESGAAWMSERAFIPLTAAGLRKGDVPYPLGARQALSLDDPADVQQLANQLGMTIPDPASFCTTILELSKALPPVAQSRLIGLEFEERFFAWAGPLLALQEEPPVPMPSGLDQVLRAAGATPYFHLSAQVNQSRAAGLLPVYETDRTIWKRQLLLPGNGDQHLVVKPPDMKAPVVPTRS